MDFFDRLGETITTKGQEAVVKAKELTEIAKLKSKISSAEYEIQNCYKSMGLRLYTEQKEYAAETFPETVDKLEELKAEIEKLHSQILAVKNATVCPSCGKESPAGTPFCCQCGKTLIVPEAEEAGAETAAEEEEIKAEE